MRWLALLVGAALIALAFIAASRVTDTREGLVAEIVTLLGGGAGFLLLTYAFAARKRSPAQPAQAASPAPPSPQAKAHPRSNRDLLLGAGGIALALALLTGLAFSGGPEWAGFGLALLLPMLAGSVYLCLRYLRANP